MKRELLLHSLKNTQYLAAKIAHFMSPQDVVTLRGDLGTGKSELARALIRTLMGENETVPSPTFTLVQTYETEKGELWHFDLYRIKVPEEAEELGLDEALRQHMVVIEWPEKLGRKTFKNNLDIQMILQPSGISRRLILEGSGHWASFLQKLKGVE